MKTLSQNEIKKTVRKMKTAGQKASSTPDGARKALMAIGILDKKGKPSKFYFSD